jgi:hypothetical protein
MQFIVKALTKVHYLLEVLSCFIQNILQSTLVHAKKTTKDHIQFWNTDRFNGNCDDLYYRAKKLLGTCIYVAEGPRDVFARTMMLFSLTDTVLDEDSSGQTLQL